MRILFSIILFSLFLLDTNAQCIQDTLFQRGLVWAEEYVVGKRYKLQREKTVRKALSPFVKADEVPEFLYLGSEPANAVNYNEIGDKPLVFLGQENNEDLIIRGDTFSFAVLRFECNGEQYRTFRIQTRNKETSWYTNPLRNDLVDMEFVEKIEEALVGKTVYVLTAEWFKDRRTYNAVNLYLAEGDVCKYCPVQIVAVENSSNDYFEVYFQSQGSDDAFCFVNMQFGEKRLKASNNFYRGMTFEDPRGKYPKISDKKWRLIREQRIEKGLTTEEVKIAFGKPHEEFNKNGDDVWVYYNNNEKDYVLTFKKGKVTDYYIGPASRYLHLIF